MKRLWHITGALALILAWNAPAISAAAQTLYTLPGDVHWSADTTKGIPSGSLYAYLRGKESAKCGQLIRRKYPNGFTYPWHANGVYGIYTVLSGTLVFGFDKQHRKSKERVLPAGSVVQGLTHEPHYTRAIGETIFDVYVPCS